MTCQDVIENKIQSSLVYLERPANQNIKTWKKREEKMTLGLINANPVVHAKKERVPRTEESHSHSDDCVDPLEIYDILFPLTHFFLLFELKNEMAILDSNRKFCERYKRSRASLFSRAAERSI